MKKIKLNPEKLQLKKEKIANLTQEEMNNVNGGIEIALKKSKGNSRASSGQDPFLFYQQQSSRFDLPTMLMALSAAVMKADGKILKSELDYVKDFFRQQFSPQLSTKYISDFKDILKKNFVLIEICNTINNSMPIRQRSLLIQYLFGIAQADGNVSDSEMKVIQKIALAAKGINFETGKSVITAGSFKSLDDLVTLLNSYPGASVEIQGHTDNNGTPESNKTLSQERANSVKRYLSAGGVSEARMTAVGYGQEVPLADNKTEAGKTKNRRVDFKLVY